MRDRYELIGRWTCAAFAGVLVLRSMLAMFRPDPLAGLRIPALPTLASGTVSTNATPAAATPGSKPPGIPPLAMAGAMPMMGPGPNSATAKPLDPLRQARLERIIQAEILGPSPRPMPLTLLGIAGNDAFIRTTNGLSGLVHEGSEFGGIRLVRIGVNRVLVDDAGNLKELTLFNGAGGESLLPSPKSPKP